MADRQAHTLESTKSTSRPNNVILFDTETSPDPQPDGSVKQRLRLGVVTHCRNTRGETLRVQSSLTFRTPDEFWEFVDHNCWAKSLSYLVAHNIVFDLTVLDGFRCLPRMGWTLDSWYSKGLVSLFHWSCGNRKIVCMDNTNLFPGKLAKWGDLLGYPKLSVDFAAVTDAELIPYCQRDVEIMVRLWRLWVQILDDNRWGAFKSTLASTAFNAWRHRYLHATVHIHDNSLALHMERDSYHGARVECLYQGRLERGPYYYLDVNSMYGYVLSRYQYPCGLLGATDHASTYHLLKRIDKHAVIARVTIETDDNPFPVQVDGHLAYPLGWMTVTLTTPELMLCIERGWLREVHAMAWYREAMMFRDYVLDLYAIRRQYAQSGNNGFAEISKLLGNSLYGKFGQNGIEQRIIGDCPPDELWSETVVSHTTGQVYRHQALAGHIYEETHHGESYHSFPGIAAHVTAYARLYLWRLMRQVPEGHVYYVDTDSLIVDQVGYDSLGGVMSETQLGWLKTELRSPWIEIRAPKDYSMVNRTRIKGVSQSSIEIAPGRYAQDQWVRLPGMLRAGDMDGFTVRPVVKRLVRQIHSGVVLPSGWVRPFVLARPEPESAARVCAEIDLSLSRPE